MRCGRTFRNFGGRKSFDSSDSKLLAACRRQSSASSQDLLRSLYHSTSQGRSHPWHRYRNQDVGAGGEQKMKCGIARMRHEAGLIFPDLATHHAELKKTIHARHQRTRTSLLYVALHENVEGNHSSRHIHLRTATRSKVRRIRLYDGELNFPFAGVFNLGDRVS